MGVYKFLYKHVIVFTRRVFATLLALSIPASIGFAQTQVTLEELDEYDSPKVKQWVEENRQRTKSFVSAHPLKDAITNRYNELKAQPKPVTVQFTGVYDGKPADMRAFFAGGSMKLSINGGEAITLVDKQSLPPQNDMTLLKLSPDFKKIAFCYVEGGSDWQIWQIVNIPQSAAEQPTFSTRSFESNIITEPNWDNTSTALYYAYLGDRKLIESSSPQRRVQVRLHTVEGQSQTFVAVAPTPLNDVVVYEDSLVPPHAAFGAQETTDEQIIVYRTQGVAEVPIASFLLKKSDALKGDFSQKKALLKPYNFFGSFLGIQNGKAFFRTSSCEANGNFYCIMTVDLKTLERRTVVAAQDGEMLINALLTEQYLYMQYFRSGNFRNFDGHNPRQFHARIEVADLNGKNQMVAELSESGIYPIGRFNNFSASKWSKTVDFSFSNFLDGIITFRIHPKEKRFEQLNPRMATFDKTKIKVELTHYDSDGYKVPIQIFTLKDQPAGKPYEFAYLYYYGAIGIPGFAFWSTKMQMMLEMGGMVAMPLVRGGGDFGLEWQLFGSKNKDLTFADIAKGSRFLRAYFNIARDPWGQKRVIGSGRSFGGWHTFAEMVFYNDDFSAFIPVVPTFDLAYNLMFGTNWWIVDDLEFTRDRETGEFTNFENDLRRVSKWDPIHYVKNLKVDKPTLIFSGDHDVRVKPTQPYRGYLTLRQKFPDSPHIFLMDYAFTGHNSRPEGLDEVLWISQLYSLTNLSPLK